MKYIKTYEQFLNEDYLYEAMTPEERREKRKARRLAKKQNITGSGNKNFDLDVEDLDAVPSQSMTHAVEKYREEMVKLQDLQKEFVLTPKDNIAKREILKKQLIVQSKIAKKAELEFEKMVSQEDGEADDLFF